MLLPYNKTLKAPRYSCSSQQVSQPTDPSIRLIPLTRGQVAIVDAEDFDRLSEVTWRARKEAGGVFYAIRQGWTVDPDNPLKKKFGEIRMHREVLDYYTGPLCVDHANGNTLDNRKANLRLATAAQNTYNSLRNAANNLTGFVGVFETRSGFKSMLAHEGTKYNFGPFETAEEASAAREAKAIELRGEFYCAPYKEAA